MEAGLPHSGAARSRGDPWAFEFFGTRGKSTY